MATPSVPVRFLIISDTHTAQLLPDDEEHAFRHPMPEADVVLHCGDLTMVGALEEYRKCLDMLSHIKAELKLVIAGNHDLSLDPNYHDKHTTRNFTHQMRKQANEIMRGPSARAAGVTYLDEGLHRFELSSGATFSVWASPYTPEFGNWGFPYERHEDRFNPKDPLDFDPYTKNIAKNPVPDYPQVDIVMTHGPPVDHLGLTARGPDAGCGHLLRALKRAKPRLHCFGHIHEAWGAEIVEWSKNDDGPEKTIWSRTQRTTKARKVFKPAWIDTRQGSTNPMERGKHTLLVNAAIMDLQYCPFNSPWVVDMDLPKGTQ
ncbi:MAG: hypothetical protein Q9162_005454 [Coniocarpon cinnabarinum]